MKLLLLNQFFHPDHSATAQLATDLAEDLAAAGHQVTALASRGVYLGGAPLPARERHRGVEIVRVRATSLGKASLPRRLADYLTFLVAAAARALTLPRADVVVAMSTPPLVATVGALHHLLRGSRFVYWLQDVYPELAVEFGLVRRGGLAARAFDLVSRWILGRASAVVVLGEAMASRVEAKGVPRRRIHVVPNWADGGAIRPVAPEANAFRREQGLDGKRVVLYSGNMGRAHDLATVLGAARLLREEQDLVFLFVGDGARRAEVEAAARELPSIRLLPYQPRERLAESLSAGDLHVVTQDPATLGLVEPSKLYGILAAGRPVLFVGPAAAEVGATVLREGVGEVVAPGDPPAAAASILRLLGQADELGPRARAAFEARYDRGRAVEVFEAVLRSVREEARP